MVRQLLVFTTTYQYKNKKNHLNKYLIALFLIGTFICRIYSMIINTYKVLVQEQKKQC